MNFSLTDEQQLLRESLSGFLARRYDFDARRAAAANGGWRPDIWQGFAEELGLFGAALSEDEGGFGGGPVETMLIAEELGRALVMEPYIESVVVANALLRDTDAADLREAIVAGSAIVVPALYEAAARFDPTVITTTGPALTGTKNVVAAGPLATHYLVSARTNDTIGLHLVDAKATDLAAATTS